MTTTIGPNTLVNGHLEGNGEVVVEGRIHGTVVLDDTLLVLDGGFVSADVEVDTIVVEGAFAGSIRASRLVHLRASSNVEAHIVCQNVRIDPGARFKGRVEMDLAAEPAARTVEETPRPATTATTSRPRYESNTRDIRSTTVARPAPRRTEPPRSYDTRTAEHARQAAPVQRIERAEPSPPAPREPEPVVSRAPKPSPQPPAPQKAAPTPPPQRQPEPKPTNGATNGSNGAVFGDPDELTVKELRDMLKEHDLPVSGTKQELVDRLRENA